jgi:hypothetical protein
MKKHSSQKFLKRQKAMNFIGFSDQAAWRNEDCQLFWQAL